MDAHWTEGYVAELAYPHDYIAALHPGRLRLPFVVAGLAPPEVRTACDLGFGQGLSVNIHAAASAVAWHGNDFNPDQALRARALAAASGSGAALTDEAFAEFCVRTDLPDFDFIGLHGVWSWVSDANRALIIDFIRRKLRVGGVVYAGYNTQPGWASTIPLRELATQHVQRMAAAGQGLRQRIEGAIAFLEQLAAADPAFMRANPSVVPLIALLKTQDPHYLAHEYFNASWRPMSFAEMASALAPAKLRYACSAHHEVEHLSLTPAQQTLVQSVADPVLRESVRDFCVNQQFRQDYWVKGAHQLDPIEQGQALRGLSVVLLTPRAEVADTVSTARGAIRLTPQLFGTVLDALHDHLPRSLAALEQVFAGTAVQLPQIAEAVMVLVAKGDLALVQAGDVTPAVKAQSDRLNLYLLEKALGRGDVQQLACPLTGGAVTLNRIEQLFLYASLDPARQPADLAALVWQVLGPQGQTLLRDGRPLTTAADNLAELGRLAVLFVQRKLPMLRATGVVPNVAKA